MENIYNVLNNYLKRSNKNRTYEVICRYVLNHLMEIPEMSVTQIAEECYTSHPSVIRFSRELGYEGIADFKYNIRNYIDEVNNHELRVKFSVETKGSEQGYVRSLNKWIDVQSDYFKKEFASLDRDKIFELCKDIHDYKNVCIVGAGLSNVAGELFRNELARCGKIVNNVSTDFEFLDLARKEDTLLIAISMYGFILGSIKREKGIRNMDAYLKERTAKSWLITLKSDDVLMENTIAIGDRKTSFDITLNLIFVFFEVVSEHYQALYP